MVCKIIQEKAQEIARALFSEMNGNGSPKTLSGELFQCLVDCERLLKKANAVLADHLYETSTEKILHEFARILKECFRLGEQIEAVLTGAAAANDNSSSATVDGDESDQEMETDAKGDESDEEMETDAKGDESDEEMETDAKGDESDEEMETDAKGDESDEEMETDTTIARRT